MYMSFMYMSPFTANGLSIFTKFKLSVTPHLATLVSRLFSHFDPLLSVPFSAISDILAIIKVDLDKILAMSDPSCVLLQWF